LAGLNEVLAVLLLAAKFGVPVCPHAGGIGLCEYVQHVSAIDYIAVSGSLDDRSTEYAEHLHEHFVDPVRVEGGRYRLPQAPGYSAQMKPASLAALAYPGGAEWRR
jgi:L-fuconate dehydratase